jgi:rfaE bifunctional protein nucleotidyltransferase chain/domain
VSAASHGRVVDLEALASLLEEDRAAGRRVAFANGCFDILHVGHVRYLQGASAEGERLVVAVNDDESVRELKGDGRPIMGAADRAELVAAVRGVDYVIVFPGRTVGPLLERLRPDVHCKGTDYTVESVPERAIVEAYGGRTAIVGDPKDHSTTALLSRIADAAATGTSNEPAGALHEAPGLPRADDASAERRCRGAGGRPGRRDGSA